MGHGSSLSRRALLHSLGVAACGAVVGSSRARASGRYVVLADGEPRDRIEQWGFSVTQELADGDVLIVDGEAGQVDRLKSRRGVADAIPDFSIASPVTPQRRRPHWRPTATDGADSLTREDMPESVRPDPPFHPRQWDKALTDAKRAHDITTGSGARIGMLDTGIYAGHPDLAPNLNEDLSVLVTNEGLEHDVTVKDPLGHGTHTAGIAAGSGDEAVVGMAPDAELVSISTAQESSSQRIPSTSPPLSKRLLGLEYAASIDLDIVSSTLAPGGLDLSARAATAVRIAFRLVRHAVDSGTLVVQAAGNDLGEGEQDLKELEATGKFYPPGNTPGALTVGATTPTMERAFYSYNGRGVVDVAAPGGGCRSANNWMGLGDCHTLLAHPRNFLFSTAAPDSTLYFAYPGGSGNGRDMYAYHQGTSMATPQVAGAAALVASIAPTAGPEVIARALKDGAVGGVGETPFRPGQALSYRASGSAGRYSTELGAGHLNAYNALQSSVLDGFRDGGGN